MLIFRIVQEALSNVQRHSDASDASVILVFKPETLDITIQDNGVGFSLKTTLASLAAKDKLGIAGIQQRVNFLEGTLNIRTAPAKGTMLIVHLKC